MKYISQPALASLAVASLLWSVTTQAAPLLPGNSIPPSPVLAPAGATVLTNVAFNFVGLNNLSQPVFSGTLLTTVLANDLNNPLGGLTFGYRIINNSFPSSIDAIGELNIESFAGFALDVGVESAGLPGVVKDPLLITRTGLPVPDSKLEFLFKTPLFAGFQDNLLPGETSPWLLVRTAAQAYDLGNANVINSAVATVATFVPAVVIPEPTTLSLALASVIALVARRKLS